MKDKNDRKQKGFRKKGKETGKQEAYKKINKMKRRCSHLRHAALVLALADEMNWL